MPAVASAFIALPTRAAIAPVFAMPRAIASPADIKNNFQKKRENTNRTKNFFNNFFHDFYCVITLTNFLAFSPHKKPNLTPAPFICARRNYNSNPPRPRVGPAEKSELKKTPFNALLWRAKKIRQDLRISNRARIRLRPRFPAQIRKSALASAAAPFRGAAGSNPPVASPAAVRRAGAPRGAPA